MEARTKELDRIQHGMNAEMTSSRDILRLHDELKEQEEVLAIFQTQRNNAREQQKVQQEKFQLLSQESEDLRKKIQQHTDNKIAISRGLKHVQEQQTLFDVCSSLTSWTVTETTATCSVLVRKHCDGSESRIRVQFAAKPPNIICQWSMEEGDSLTLLARLCSKVKSDWAMRVNAAKTLPALQQAMQYVDLEVTRLEALVRDLELVRQYYVVPESHIAIAGEHPTPDSCCTFVVSFSCLEPASQWSVRFDVKRGYPFGLVEVTSETEFGARPLDISNLHDVAFGYGRLLRACQYLEPMFQEACKNQQSKS